MLHDQTTLDNQTIGKIVKLEPNKPQVFLSYNREDQSAVEILADRLRESGFEPWMDYKDWINEINTAYDLCKIWLVCIGAKGSDPSLNIEIQTAIYSRDNGGAFYVIPVLLPGADHDGLNNQPVHVESTKSVEFPKSMDDEESFRHLLAAIQEACSKYDQFKKQNSAESAQPSKKESSTKSARIVKKTIRLAADSYNCVGCSGIFKGARESGLLKVTDHGIWQDFP